MKISWTQPYQTYNRWSGWNLAVLENVMSTDDGITDVSQAQAILEKFQLRNQKNGN